jgi:hypothetical protein
VRVSFLVPAFNEAATIEEVLRRVGELPFDKQMIAIDDGSTDATGELPRPLGRARRPAARDPPTEPRQRCRHPRRDPAHRRRHRSNPGR